MCTGLPCAMAFTGSDLAASRSIGAQIRCVPGIDVISDLIVTTGIQSYLLTMRRSVSHEWQPNRCRNLATMCRLYTRDRRVRKPGVLREVTQVQSNMFLNITFD